MQVTLDPKNDDAATTALYVYAALTNDEALTKRLWHYGKVKRFDTLFHFEEGAVGSTVNHDLLGKLGLRPVRLVCVNESGWEDVA